MIRNFLFGIILIVCTILSLSCKDIIIEPEQKNYEYQKARISIATSGSEKGINTLTAKKLSKLISDETEGQVQIEVYSNDQLAGGNTIKGVKMLADGSVDMAIYTSGSLSNLDQNLSVITIPWLFKDYYQARKVIETSGAAYYEKLLAKQGLIYLGCVHNGFKQISNNKNEIKTPEDLKDLKIRVLINEDYSKFFKLFGANPKVMSLSEMSIVLRQGAIDGHDMSIYQSATDKPNLIEKYITILNYAYEVYILAINQKTFDELDLKTQNLLKNKCKEACDWGNDKFEEEEIKLKRKFLEQGVVITELSDDELQLFKNKAQPLINQMKVKYGEDTCREFGIY